MGGNECHVAGTSNQIECNLYVFRGARPLSQATRCTVAFYFDKHSVFRVAKKDARGGQGMTQFGRALCELNIEILCANSSQAKGRVERMNRRLQDRLVRELRLAGSSDMETTMPFYHASWRIIIGALRSSLPGLKTCYGRSILRLDACRTFYASVSSIMWVHS